MDTMLASLGVRPLFGLKVAVVLIPMRSVGALKTYLCRNRHRFPARYHGKGRHRRRMPTDPELIEIRKDNIREGTGAKEVVDKVFYGR